MKYYQRYCICADWKKVYIKFIKPIEIDYNEVAKDFVQAMKKLVEEDPYMLREYTTICEYNSFEELYSQHYMDENSKLQDIWNTLEFIDLDEDFIYMFEEHDSIFVKDKKIYGVIKEIKSDGAKTLFWVIPDPVESNREDKSKWFACTAENLEYDERPETIEFIKDGHASYMERVWGVDPYATN